MTTENISEYINFNIDGLKFSDFSSTIEMVDSKTFVASITPYKATSGSTLQVSLNPSLKSVDNIPASQSNYATSMPTVRVPALTATTKAAITAVQGSVSTASAAVVSTSAPSFLLGGNPALIWALINLLQIFYYLLFINVNYPPNVQAFFKIFSIGNLDFFPSPKSVMQPYQMNITQYISMSSPQRFSDQNVDGSFLLTAGGMMSFMLGALMFYLLVKGILNLLRFLPIRFINFLRTIKRWFEWSGLIRIWITSYLSLSVAACLQLNAADFSTNWKATSSGIGICMFLANLYLPLKLFKIILKYNFDHSRIKVLYSSLVEEFTAKKSSTIQSYTVILLTKRFVYAFVLVFMHDYPYAELVILIAICSFSFIFVLGNNPYSSTLNKISHIMEEAVFFLVHIIIFFIAYDDQNNIFDDDMKNKVGWILIFCCCLNLFLAVIIIFAEQIVTFYKAYYAFKNYMKVRKFLKKKAKNLGKVIARHAPTLPLRPSPEMELHFQRLKKIQVEDYSTNTTGLNNSNIPSLNYLNELSTRELRIDPPTASRSNVPSMHEIPSETRKIITSMEKPLKIRKVNNFGDSSFDSRRYDERSFDSSDRF